VVKDTSLWFYYPENLKALEQAGGEIVQVSLLEPDPWPEIHGLYLGGGFPETQAAALSRNRAILEHIAVLAEKGMPIYAECGGLMVLCAELSFQESSYTMAGVFPVRTEVSRKPQGHGYTLARVEGQNPYHPVGIEFSGHEFHYSRCTCLESSEPCLRMIRGTGLGSGGDGMLFRNTFACYTHLHALSVPSWAPNFVRAAHEFKFCMDKDHPTCSRIIAT
jgi:cobyrinic acid a,c-diamide synthase